MITLITFELELIKCVIIQYNSNKHCRSPAKPSCLLLSCDMTEARHAARLSS